MVHVRALYSEENNSKWMNEFRRLNPTKGNTEIDGTYEVEPFAKETDHEMLFLKSCYDGFHETALHSFLQEKNIERVRLCWSCPHTQVHACSTQLMAPFREALQTSGG